MNEMTIASADVSLTVLPEIGGRIHRLRAFGHDVLRTPADPEQHLREPFFWGAYVMAPWGGRIDAGETNVAGAKVDVPANFSDGSAIHGQVHSRPWRVDGPGELSVSAGEDDAWPWRYTASSVFKVIGRTLRVEQTLFNHLRHTDAGRDRPAPMVQTAGAGAHQRGPGLQVEHRFACGADERRRSLGCARTSWPDRWRGCHMGSSGRATRAAVLA